MQDCGTGSGHAGLLSDVIASPFVSGELWNGSFAAAKDSAGAACLYLAVPVRQRPRISYFFDADYYLRRNPDVAESGCDPLIHFIESGCGECRSPHPLVDIGVTAQLLTAA